MSITKGDGPQPGDGKRLAAGVSQRAQEGAGSGIEGVDVTVSQVRHQKRVAEGSEITGRKRNAPGCVQGSHGGKTLLEVSVQVVNIHDAETSSSYRGVLGGVLLGIGDIEFSAKVSDVVGSVPRRKTRICE